MTDWFQSLFTVSLVNPHVWGFLVSVPFIVGGLLAKVVISCIMAAWFVDRIL